MQQMMIELPDTSLQLIKLSVESFVEELRLATATQFYQQNRLSLDIAAQLAGLATDEFSQEIKLAGKNKSQSTYENDSNIWADEKSILDITPSPMSKESNTLDIRVLAEQQGVQPIQDINDFQTGFWPEDESIDDFVQTIRDWRNESLAIERELPADE